MRIGIGGIATKTNAVQPPITIAITLMKIMHHLFLQASSATIQACSALALKVVARDDHHQVLQHHSDVTRHLKADGHLG